MVNTIYTKNNMTEKLALITGSSSGIGKAFATKLASQGYNLILVARREKLLKELCTTLEKQYRIKAEYMPIELSDMNNLKKLENKIKQAKPEILINNAGYNRLSYFHEDSLEEQEKILRTHVTATIKLTHAAIPGMLARKKGIIINTSSISAYYLGPNTLMYSATKAFLHSFSQSLYLELLGTGIQVQSLLPGFTATDFHKKLGNPNSKPRFMGLMTPEQVVESSLACLKKGKPVCIPGFKNKLLVLGFRFMPRKLLYKFVMKGKLAK